MSLQSPRCDSRATLGAGVKYEVNVSRRAPQAFRLLLGESHVDIVGRKLNDGGLLIQVRSVSSIPCLLMQRLMHLVLVHGALLLPPRARRGVEDPYSGNCMW